MKIIITIDNNDCARIAYYSIKKILSNTGKKSSSLFSQTLKTTIYNAEYVFNRRERTELDLVFAGLLPGAGNIDLHS